MVIVPATVPVCTPILVEGVTDPAGMVSCMVLPPPANWMAGSSGPASAANARVAVTFTSMGYGELNPICRFCCTPGLALAGSPVTFTAGALGSATVTVKLRLEVTSALSLTVTVMLDVPAVVGVPEKTPPVERLTPGGSPVAVHVKGGTPPLAVESR